ncbi:thioredoxin family protein [Paenibacillus sp. KN14-4R]|uniref:thioredoxin family protein n=1 Tax=Paenibacillus sp. KN14-4R TaxID=3445773 RepID=UPI003F9F5B4C
MQKISTEQRFREEIASDTLTIAVFKTVWCKDCHFIDLFMPDVVQHYANQVKFIELDRDEVLDLCEELHILGIPSFIAFKKGQEVVRFVSKLRKTRDEIEQFVDRAIAVSAALGQ